RDGHATSLGAASGIVAGLVALTPSCSSVNVFGALVIGAVAGVVCALAVGLKYRFGFDDSLDVVGVHLFGGLVGTLLIGLLAAPETAAIHGVTGVSPGLFYGGGVAQLGRQTVGAFSVLAYSALLTAILALAMKHTIGLRLAAEDEAAGIDEAQHAEGGYDFAVVGSSVHAHGEEERGHEADYRDRKAVYARGHKGPPGGSRSAGDDGQRSPGVRETEGAH
ncbi:MAG: ammonium transporter, partial [Mycobacterium sp.]